MLVVADVPAGADEDVWVGVTATIVVASGVVVGPQAVTMVKHTRAIKEVFRFRVLLDIGLLPSPALLTRLSIISRVFCYVRAPFDRVIFRDRRLTLKIRRVISGDYIKSRGGEQGGNLNQMKMS